MSSPTKGTESASKLPDLAPWELRLLIFGSLCYGDAKPDMDKLAKLAGIKKTSASNYWRVKRRLESLVEKEGSADENDASKGASPEASPTKPRATKRRKTISKPVVDPETDYEQLQVEEHDEPAPSSIKEEPLE